MVIDGTLELDSDLFELRRGGVPVPLEPQAFDVLTHLVEHRDRVVSKEELMEVVWGSRFVSESSVTSRIKQIRRALGDDGQEQRMIRTMRGRGYRFVADVQQRRAQLDAAPVGHPGPRQPIRYTTTDGLHVAYQVSGGGERDIVLISGFISHLEIDWDDPRHAYFLDQLGRMGRLIRFDKRGTGMSDRPVGVPDLETRMHDVLAVMDAVDSQRAVLVGYSEGGPMAVLMAAMRPERVSSLVLYGSYARRTRAGDYPWGRTGEERAAYTQELVSRWDWEADLRMRCPSGDEAMQRWWARRMRASATPGTVRALMDMNAKVDVRDLLPSVRVPTLVLHRTGDALFGVEEARYLADRIPGARLALLEGSDHLVCGDPAQLIDAIEPFITAAHPRVEHQGLAVVAVTGGPGADDVVAALVRAGGRSRPLAEGLAVLFDGLTTAVRAGLAALAGGADAAIGVAVAEVGAGAGPVSGPGVELARRLGAAGTRGDVLLTAATSALLAGTDTVLEPVGPRDVGTPEPQHVLRARRP